MLRLETNMFNNKSSQNIFGVERTLKETIGKEFRGKRESLLCMCLYNIYVYLELNFILRFDILSTLRFKRRWQNEPAVSFCCSGLASKHSFGCK